MTEYFLFVSTIVKQPIHLHQVLQVVTSNLLSVQEELIIIIIIMIIIIIITIIIIIIIIIIYNNNNNNNNNISALGALKQILSALTIEKYMISLY